MAITRISALLVAAAVVASCGRTVVEPNVASQEQRGSAPAVDVVPVPETSEDASAGGHPEADVEKGDGGTQQATSETAADVGAQYPYEPAVVELQGILQRETRFGPPNYGETPQLDKRVQVYILELEQPITVGTKETLSELNEAPVAGVTKIQLAFHRDVKANKATAGKPIVVNGMLSTQQLSNDFYPVILREARLK